MQRKYPVMVLVAAVSGEARTLFVSRLAALMKIGKYMKLQGFVADSSCILQYSGLSRDLVKKGWRLLSWGEKNLDQRGIRAQWKLGVTGFVTDNVSKTKKIVDHLLKKYDS
jgi:glycerophosphoryl diester phosphodiesterase